MDLERFEKTLNLDEIKDQLESILQGTVITAIDHVMMCRMFLSVLKSSQKRNEI